MLNQGYKTTVIDFPKFVRKMKPAHIYMLYKEKYYEKFISADSFIRIVNSLTYVNQKALSSVDRYAISFLAVCM
jgi:hypothetical protein